MCDKKNCDCDNSKRQVLPESDTCKAEPLKEINVKRIFFYEDDSMPTKSPFFELENGEIKRPYFVGTNAGLQALWFTDKELAERNERVNEMANKPKIINLFGKK
jgi:hypothetical protein